MNFLSDTLRYMRQFLKTPSDTSISDDILIDFLNRFFIMDLDARIQVFDLKTKYQFLTTPGQDQYNMPMYNFQTEEGSQTIGMYPVYQGFLAPAYINGIQINFSTLKTQFFQNWPNWAQQNMIVGQGNGSEGPYTFNIPISPNNTTPANPPIQALLRGHVDIQGIISTGVDQDPPIGVTLPNSGGTPIQYLIPSTSIIPAVYFTTQDATGANLSIQDSGVFLTGNVNYGLLMQPGSAPFGYNTLPNPLSEPDIYSTTQNTINYLTGVATNVYFPTAVPNGANINAICYYFQCGLPRSMLYYNNTITLRCPPDNQYLVEIDAYLSPCAFMNSAQALPYAYMSEYLALGAARKIMYSTGDAEQLAFYEPFFIEQERLVWKRSQRQFTATRTPSLYQQDSNQDFNGGSSYGGYGGI
jgi:hypothetical protein